MGRWPGSPPAGDLDCWPRRCLLPNTLGEAAIELTAIIGRRDSLLYQPGEISVPVGPVDGARCTDFVDPEVEIAVDVK